MGDDDTLAGAAEDPTTVAPSPVELAQHLAWQDEDLDENIQKYPWRLWPIVAVVVAGVGLAVAIVAAVVVWNRQPTIVPVLGPGSGAVGTGTIAPDVHPGGLPTTTTATTTSTEAPPHFPPDAWTQFMDLLHARGLDIDPAQRDYDDRANKHLCMTLYSNDDPTARARLIQETIDQSEAGTWGPAEATYAVHSALKAYCPQYDRP
jgi:hypothetical protein